MKNQKKQDKSLLKKGDYITSVRSSGDVQFIVGVCEGASKDKARIKGYIITPASMLYGFEKTRARLLGYSEAKFTLDEVILDKLEYTNFNGIINVNENLRIIEKNKYKLLEEWLNLGLPDLFSSARQIDEKDKKKIKSLRSKLEEKLKQANSKELRSALQKAIKGLK